MTQVNIRPEYPRPDFERTEWLSLNGQWEFDFDDENIGECERWYLNRSFSKKILVPFCYQSRSSGINDQSLHEFLWYKKEFEIPENFEGKRILLHFGAVDYRAKVWLNGEYVGLHTGGHVSFKMDVTRFLKDGINCLVVKSEDKYECVQPRGKQYWEEKPDRCWYTATSGIWQSVWIEAAGEVNIDRFRITPDIDRRSILVETHFNDYVDDLNLGVKVIYKEKLINALNIKISSRITRFTVDIKEYDSIDEQHYWTPETPNLYDIEFTLLRGENRLDYVKSYFGMRKISVKGDQILLNNKPYYQKLILDQGYWPESLLTPPSDEAIIYDIEMTKKFGFNGARKHQKFEDPRYYYWADKLGLLVWGEMPSAYHFNSEEIENITSEWMDFINRDYNHPCIVTWVPLNESWGVRNIISDKDQQNFAAGLYYMTKAMDSTRLISTNDGWEMVEQSDICGIHDYTAWGEDFTPKYAEKDQLLSGAAQVRMLYCEGHKYKGEPILVTEYGGIAFKSDSKEEWGYFGAVEDEESFLKRYLSITEAIKNTPYIRGYCYTQLTDVMQEVNGLMTADRKVKVDINKIRNIMK